MDDYCGSGKYVYRVAENRNNIPIRIEVTQTTAPRLLRKCKSGHHEYFHRFSILFCKSALHIEALLRNAFTITYLHTYVHIISKYPSAHMRGQGTSASLRLDMYIPHNAHMNRLSLKVSKQKVGE